MNKKKVFSNYIIKTFQNGYCIVNNFISKKETEKNKIFEKLNQSLSKNKRF